MMRVPPIAGAFAGRLLAWFGPWAVIARHAIPVVGVLAFGWSVLECVLAVFLDSISTFCCLGAAGSFFAVRDFAYEDQDVIDRLNLVFGGIFVFVLLVGLLTFAIGVPGSMLLAVTLQASRADVWQTAQNPALWKTFGAMVLFQLPRLRHFLELGSDAAKPLVQREIGLILFRHIVIGMLCVVLGILPEGVVLVGTLLLVQVVLAGSEMYADQIAFEIDRMPPRTGAARDAGVPTSIAPSGAPAARRGWARRRRKRRKR